MFCLDILYHLHKSDEEMVVFNFFYGFSFLTIFFMYLFTLSTNNVMQISTSYKMRNTGHPTLDQHNLCQCQGYLNMRSNTKLQYSSGLSSVSISALYLSVKVIIVESTVQGFSHEVILCPESGHNHLL